MTNPNTNAPRINVQLTELEVTALRFAMAALEVELKEKKDKMDPQLAQAVFSDLPWLLDGAKAQFDND